jgi:hypothetical protein
MKHFFTVFSFLIFGLSACTGCTKTDTTTPVCTGNDCKSDASPTVVEIPPVVISADAGVAGGTTPEPLDLPDHNYSGLGWKLVVPAGWETVSVEGESENYQLVLQNPDEHNLILVVKEPFAKATSDYTLSLIKGFTEDGVKVNSTTQTELNGKHFIVIDTQSEGARIWFWVTVQNKFGYVLSCGGPAAEDHHEALCNDLSKTFNIQ